MLELILFIAFFIAFSLLFVEQKESEIVTPPVEPVETVEPEIEIDYSEGVSDEYDDYLAEEEAFIVQMDFEEPETVELITDLQYFMSVSDEIDWVQFYAPLGIRELRKMATDRGFKGAGRWKKGKLIDTLVG